MPRRGSESDSSHRGRSRKKKSKKSTKRSSSSASSSSCNSNKEKPKRYRIKSRSRSHSRDRKSRSKSHEREFSSRSSSHKRSRRKYEKRRSTSRHRSKRDRRSRSRSRGRRSKRSPSNSNSDSHSRNSKISSKYSRSSSVSPRRSKPYKTGSDKLKNMTEDEILKAKLQAAFKAAATADALLREKGLLPDSSKDSKLAAVEIAELTIDEQMKRAQAIEDINTSSFVQQDFKSTRAGAKKKLEPSEKAAIETEGNGAEGKPFKLDDSWKNNAEKLVHPNLFKDIDAKMDRWKEKLTAMRSRRNDGDSLI